MIILGDCVKVLKDFEFNCIDLTVTSPPYDQLRSYDGHSNFDFVTFAKELLRVTKRGGVLVWVTNDQTINFDETGTSFKQVLEFKKCGWKLHDTMLYRKTGITFPDQWHKRYQNCFEFMFVFCKGTVRKFHPILDYLTKEETHKSKHYHYRDPKTGRLVYKHYKKYDKHPHAGLRENIWIYQTGYLKATKDIVAYQHPAIFPELLAYDHIRSWTNEGDYVLDPFLGSGTTYKMALKLNRIPIGIEVNPKYVTIAKKRLHRYLEQKKEFGKLL
jgi:DNA modification methylase